MKFKRDMAEKLGATHTFESMDDARPPSANTPTSGQMANTVVLTVGEMKGEYVAPAMAMVAKGGQAIIVGMGDFQAMDTKLNLFDLTLTRNRFRVRSSAEPARAPRSPNSSTNTAQGRSTSLTWSPRPIASRTSTARTTTCLRATTFAA